MPNSWTLVEMAKAVGQRRISPRELVDAHLARIGHSNRQINAFIEVYADEARARALAPLEGPLAGVPVTVKDSFDIAGRVTACGSLLRRGAVAERDSVAVKRLRAAGAIVIGKTSCPEFLYNYETENRLIGRTAHPLDAGFTCGGSSGGEAAAIAAQMSAGGIGSDGGGSIREPAHFCGICGLKPTPGRVPAAGHWPEISHPTGFMGVGGPMARTVADVALLFGVLAGHDAGDPFSVPVELRAQPSAGVRIAMWDACAVESACAEAVSRAAARLSALGHPVVELPAELIEGAHELWRALFIDYLTPGILAMVEGSEAECSTLGLELTRMAGETVDVGRLGRILLERDRMRARLLKWLGSDTVILAPGFGVTAFRHGQREFETPKGRITLLDAVRVVSPWNLLGMPSLAVPVLHGEGMPAGVQLIGEPWCEERLLDLGVRFEQS